MFSILRGIRVIFAVPLIHLKSGAPPTVDPRVLNFKGSNFKTLLTIFWGRAHVFLLIGVRLLIGTRDYDYPAKAIKRIRLTWCHSQAKILIVKHI